MVENKLRQDHHGARRAIVPWADTARPDHFWVPVAAFPHFGAGLNEWHECADYGIGWLARAVDELCRQGFSMTGWLSKFPGGAFGCGQHCCDACSLCVARACRKARRAGGRQQRLQKRAQAVEGGQRCPHHGRYAQAARLHGDGGGKPEPAGVQSNIAGVRQVGRGRRYGVLLLCWPRL